MNINWKKIDLITAATIVLFGSNVATHHYSSNRASNEVIEFLTDMCSSGAMWQSDDGRGIMCFPAEISPQEKKSLDKSI